MRVVWSLVGVVLLGLSTLTQAQPAPPEPPAARAPAPAAQSKAAWYAQVEYARCRQDVLELLEKADQADQRARTLDEELRKVSEELKALKEKDGAKPAN